MKKYLLLVMLLSVTILIAQNKITGFGILELGSPITIINELGYDYDSTEKISNYPDYQSKIYNNNNLDKLYELVADSNQKSQGKLTSLGVSLDKRVRVFVLPGVELKELSEIERIRLKFFNDSLIGITYNSNNDLSESLTKKYGDPTVDIQTGKEKRFVISTPAESKSVVKAEEEQTSTWPTNVNDITCTEVIKREFDDEGEYYYTRYVQLSNHEYDNEIIKQEKLEIKKIIKREQKKQKNSTEELK